MRAGFSSSGLLLCGTSALLYWRPLQAPHQTAAVSKFGQLLHPLALLGLEVVTAHHCHQPQGTAGSFTDLPKSYRTFIKHVSSTQFQ